MSKKNIENSNKFVLYTCNCDIYFTLARDDGEACLSDQKKEYCASSFQQGEIFDVIIKLEMVKLQD